MDLSQICLSLSVCLLCFTIGIYRSSSTSSAEEPVCPSQFDFGYKTIQKLIEIEQNLDKLANKGGLSVYTRWGKNSCPSDATIVYYGYSAGKKYNDKGGGSDTICLPSDPTWLKYHDGNDAYRSHVYGTEIDIANSKKNVFDNDVNEQDSPCAVCSIPRAVNIMIPGRSNCFDGWKLEYNGYLMSAYFDHNGPYSHVCVDKIPDFVPNGGTNNNQHIFYLVETRCGSLPCPPYVEGRELACAVCSKS